AGLLAQRKKIQNEIQNLEEVLGQHSPVCVISSEEVSDIFTSARDRHVNVILTVSVPVCLYLSFCAQSELGLSPSADSCLQMNLVYQQVVQETLDQLETLLTNNHRQQKELVSQLSGPIRESSRERPVHPSCQQPINMYLGRFLKPYFKDKLTGLVTHTHTHTNTHTHTHAHTHTQSHSKKDNELVGGRYDEHDWPKISNIDFEGTREAEDIYSFWQNFLHPSISKRKWSQEEVQQLKEVSRRHGERHWDTIASELRTGRTAFLCLQTFQRFVSDSLKRGIWTPDEDVLLRELVDKMRIGNFIPYTQMSYFMEGRDPAQLIYRWNQVLDPSLKKGFWTKEEDQLLLHAVSRFGEKDWWKIRFEVPGRTDTSRWAKIAAEIPHRYDAQCLREWRRLSKPPQPPHLKVHSTGLSWSLLVSLGLSYSTMMMVSPEQLRAHLHRQVDKYSNRSSGPPPRKIQTDKRSPLSRVTDPGLIYELQAAMTPWIGNVLISQEHRATSAEALRERGGTTRLLSTTVFLLFLQTMNVDAMGCKEMIEQRRNRVLVFEPPSPTPDSSFLHNTVEQQHKLILNQLQVLHQPQLPPNMHPRMSSVSFPQAVFIPHPVSQPLSPSIRLINPCPPAPHRPPPVGVLTSLLPAHSSPHAPPASVVPVTLKATSTCSAAFRQEALPLTQNLMVALPCSANPGPAPSPSSLISRTSSPLKKRSRSSFPKKEVVIRNQPMTGLPGFCLLPGQSVWAMTPGGLVQLAEAPPQGLQLTLVPSTPLPAEPVNILNSQLVRLPPRPPTAVSVPVHPFTTLPILQPGSNPGPSPLPSCPPQPQPRLFMPYKGTFDPSLMFRESQEAVCDWLSGRGGVVVPGIAASLPYLPPFVSSLNTLSALLRSKMSLTKSSLNPDLLLEEEELVEVLRQLVAERFSGNPAYQLLKARFLSCFTVPALLATVQPIRTKTVTYGIKYDVYVLIALQRSLLLCDGSGAPANHFSGIPSTGAPLSH
uniref:snRNA-activating protein complex subunit 4 n=1 Tax=Cyclopterus lumpus TaxID=8103 RepID=A0A8C2WHF8_CYCLU